MAEEHRRNSISPSINTLILLGLTVNKYKFFLRCKTGRGPGLGRTSESDSDGISETSVLSITPVMMRSCFDNIDDPEDVCTR